MYNRIKALREDKDLSQTEMAAVLHMSQTGYSNYERGENDVPPHILIALAKYHQVTVDYILGLTDEKKPYPKSKRPSK